MTKLIFSIHNTVHTMISCNTLPKYKHQMKHNLQQHHGHQYNPRQKDINFNNNQQQPTQTTKLADFLQQAMTTITTNLIHNHPFTNDDTKSLIHKYHYAQTSVLIKSNHKSKLSVAHFQYKLNKPNANHIQGEREIESVTPRVWLKRIEVTTYITKGAPSFLVTHS